MDGGKEKRVGQREGRKMEGGIKGGKDGERERREREKEGRRE